MTDMNSYAEHEMQYECNKGAVGYPAHPQLICLSVRQSSDATFNYSAENRPGPIDLVKYLLKNIK